MGQLHCRSSQGGDRPGAAGGDGCARSGRRGHRAARGVGARGVGVVSEEECCDVLSARTDGLLWHNLVERRAWSDERYAAGLGRLWIAVLVNPADKPAVHRKHDAGRCTGAQPTRAPGPAEQSSARTQLRVLPPGLPLSRVVLAEPLAVGADLMGTGLRFARCRRPAPRLEGGVPLALSRSPAEDGAYGPLLGQGRRGREASPPSGEAPCARTGPSTRGDAAEGECRGPASTSIGRRRRGPSPRHVAHVGFPTTRAGDGRCPPRAPPASFNPTAAR